MLSRASCTAPVRPLAGPDAPAGMPHCSGSPSSSASRRAELVGSPRLARGERGRVRRGFGREHQLHVAAALARARGGRRARRARLGARALQARIARDDERVALVALDARWPPVVEDLGRRVVVAVAFELGSPRVVLLELLLSSLSARAAAAAFFASLLSCSPSAARAAAPARAPARG